MHKLLSTPTNKRPTPYCSACHRRTYTADMCSWFTPRSLRIHENLDSWLPSDSHSPAHRRQSQYAPPSQPERRPDAVRPYVAPTPAVRNYSLRLGHAWASVIGGHAHVCHVVPQRAPGVMPCSGWPGAPGQTTPFGCDEASSDCSPHAEGVQPPFPCAEPRASSCCLLATAGSCELLPERR